MMTMIKIIIALIIMVPAYNICAQELDDIVTDRPDQTESAETVPKGFLQIEAGVIVEYDEVKEDISFPPGFTMINSTLTLGSPSMLARYGITKNIEVRLGVEYGVEVHRLIYRSSIRETVWPGDNQYGWMPIVVGAKAKLLNEKGLIPNTALLVHLAIPLGDFAFQTDYVSPSFRFAFSHQLSERFAFSYNLGYEWELNKGSSVGTGIYTASFGISLVKNLSMYVETYGFLTKGETPDHRFNSGLTYLVTKNVQADVSAGIGMNEKSPDYFVSGGLSFRLPK